MGRDQELVGWNGRSGLSFFTTSASAGCSLTEMALLRFSGLLALTQPWLKLQFPSHLLHAGLLRVPCL